ncbi:MAG: HTTM domain-containing protein [Planctomycetota bacterium]
MATLRISVGGLLAADLMHRWTEVSAFYSDGGVLPRTEAPGRIFLPHFLSGSIGYVAVLLGVQVLFALALALGYRTKWVTPITWFLLISLEARNPYVLQGSDGLFRVLLLWGMFLPWGRVWSLDWRRERKARSVDERPVAARFLSFASAGVLLQVCMVYLYSAALKDHGTWFDDGSAVFRALSVDCWTTDFGRLLLANRELLVVLSRATYLLEWIGPILAFCPIGTPFFRLLAIASFWCFHLLGLAPTMYLGPFPYLSAASWLVFLPTCFWERVQEPWLRSVNPRLGILWEMLPLSLRPVPVEEGTLLSPGASGAGWLHQVLAGLLIVNLLVWNTLELDAGGAGRRLPWWWSKVAYTLRLDQRWGMFATRLQEPRTDGS